MGCGGHAERGPARLALTAGGGICLSQERGWRRQGDGADAPVGGCWEGISSVGMEGLLTMQQGGDTPILAPQEPRTTGDSKHMPCGAAGSDGPKGVGAGEVPEGRQGWGGGMLMGNPGQH